MRPSYSLLAGLAAVAGLATIAAIAGGRRRPTSAADPRASSFIAEPNGAKAFSDALLQVGVSVDKARLHQPARWQDDSGGHPIVVILGPPLPVPANHRTDLLALPSQGVALLIAGYQANSLLRCLGYRSFKLADSVLVQGDGDRGSNAWVDHVLKTTGERVVVDSAGAFDLEISRCEVPTEVTVDTLLVTLAGEPVAVRLTPSEAAPIVLVADVTLFRNRVLRDSNVGPLVLGWVAGRYDRVHFPEYLQGFSGGGSLMAWTIRWSRANPWGWAVWHWVVIGLVALGFSAVRLGPPTPLGRGRRRSVTEHVQALARALRAAGGHQVAVGLLVGGLRRRLGPATGTRGSWRPWLDSLGAASTNPKVGELVRRLVICDREKPSESEVLTAANLVEDLWTELRS